MRDLHALQQQQHDRITCIPTLNSYAMLATNTTLAWVVSATLPAVTTVAQGLAQSACACACLL
jgi:hypothetical protein